MQIQMMYNEIKTVFELLETDTSSTDEPVAAALVAKEAEIIHSPKIDLKLANPTPQGTHIQKHSGNLRCT
jgi:hypothetical protein